MSTIPGLHIDLVGVRVPPLNVASGGNTASDGGITDLYDNLLFLVIVFDVRSSFII